MPNTPGAIGHGISGLYAAKGTSAADRALAVRLLSALGDIVWVKKENLIDSVTAVSGSGPAYLFLMAEAMTEPAWRKACRAPSPKNSPAHGGGRGRAAGGGQIARVGAARSRRQPRGTTAAALNVLMAPDGLPELMKRAIAAARKRAEELG